VNSGYRSARPCERDGEAIVTVLTALAAVLTVALFGYLVFALLFPEKLS